MIRIGILAMVKSQMVKGVDAPALIITSLQVMLLAPCPRKVMAVAMLAMAMAGKSILLRLVPISLAMPTSSGIIMAAVAVALVRQARKPATREEMRISILGLLL